MCLTHAQKITPGYGRECYKVLRAFIYEDGDVKCIEYHSPYFDYFVWEIGKRHTIAADEPVAVVYKEHPINGFNEVIWDKLKPVTSIYGDALHAYMNIEDARLLALKNTPFKANENVLIKSVIARFTIPEDSKFVYTGEETQRDDGTCALCYASSDLIFEEIVE